MGFLMVPSKEENHFCFPNPFFSYGFNSFYLEVSAGGQCVRGSGVGQECLPGFQHEEISPVGSQHI